MCTNFRPATRDIVRSMLGISEPTFDYPKETWPGYMAPILIADSPGETGVANGGGSDLNAQWREAMFGLVPFWSKDTKIARNTYNARSETVAEKPSYRQAWKNRKLCLVPMQHFFEPNYESGKPVRWRIQRHDESVFTAAAIWDTWRVPTDQIESSGLGRELLHSFSLLTINADQHPVMSRFHAPGDEKRSLVIVPPEKRSAWLHAIEENEARELLRDMPVAEFTSLPDPAPPRKPRVAA